MCLKKIIAACFLLSSSAVADINSIQNMDLPVGAKTTWVATDMTHNGQGMAIKAIKSKQAVEQVLDFYRSAWEQSGDLPGFVENQIADWQVISQISDSHNLVVQVKAAVGDTTEGFISSMALKPSTERYKDSLPTPPNSAIVSRTQTGDMGKTGHTTILVSPSSVGAIVGFYKDHLDRDGWMLVSDDYIESSHVLRFNKRVSTYEVVVSPAQDGTTIILLNRTQSNG